MKYLVNFVILAMLCLTSCDTREQKSQDDMWERIQDYDLSETVINPEKIATDEISSWWSDEFIERWRERGNELKDVWYDRPSALGYRGDNYSKFDVHFLTVSKASAKQYDVNGLVRCEGVISRFSGYIVLDSLEENTDTGEYDFLRPPYHVGRISAHYEFEVPSIVAKMYGTSTYDVLEINDGIYYDAIMLVADGYYNNQYEGVWSNLSGTDVMKCNWGDYRIPDSGSLDIGAGEFAVDEQFINNGWQLLDGTHWEEYERDCLWWQEYEY